MKRAVAITIPLLFALSRSAPAVVVYSQVGTGAPIGAFSSNDIQDYQKIADNFVITTSLPATVRSVRFIGGYGVTHPPPSTPLLNALPPDNFRVVFYTDVAGAPGVPIPGGDFQVGGAAQRNPTGGPLLNGGYTPLEYTLDLGAGASIAPATVYWMSITNNPGQTIFWVWARTAGAYDQKTAVTDGDVATGPWSTATSGGMFFELRDNNVPKPSVLGSISAGIFVSSFLRSRRSLRRATAFRPVR
jgi:hypothetical protein